MLPGKHSLPYTYIYRNSGVHSPLFTFVGYMHKKNWSMQSHHLTTWWASCQSTYLVGCSQDSQQPQSTAAGLEWFSPWKNAVERYDIFDPIQSISVQESTVVTRTWDSSCQIPNGSVQLTSWLTTVKKSLGLFYFLCVGHHNPKSIGHIRLQVPCRILK